MLCRLCLVSLRQATIAGRAGKLRMQPAIAVCYSEGGSLHCAPISGAINCSTHPRSLAHPRSTVQKLHSPYLSRSKVRLLLLSKVFVL